MSIVHNPFGKLPGGETATLYTLTNAGAIGVHHQLRRHHHRDPGFMDRAGPAGGCGFGLRLGGKVCAQQRPIWARSLDGWATASTAANAPSMARNFSWAANSNGHHLHGGNVGFDQKLWAAQTQAGEGYDQLT